MKDEKIKKAVKEGYAKIARKGGSCCSPTVSCCGGPDTAQDIGKKIGYTEAELRAVPEGANLGLGCGNPTALASLKEGETVLDLGAGAGFDCFLAADRVGRAGKVIGVDMTPEMVERARGNAEKGGYKNVDFRLGEIEHLPLADSSVDAVISNCVINLAPDKARVFAEAFRVLRPGGRLMISDVVLLEELPGLIRDSVEAYIGCLSGALMKDSYIQLIKGAGFRDVRVVEESSFGIECMLNDPTARALIGQLNLTPEKVREIARSVVSIKVKGTKPGT